MNTKLEESLRWGHEYMTSLGIKPIVAGSCLMSLLLFNDLLENDYEADFAIDGDEFERLKPTIVKDSHFRDQQKTVAKEGIFYLVYKRDYPPCSFGPHYIVGDKTFYNIAMDEWLIWDKKHFEKTQTKTYRGVTYNIPYDPIGYLEEYYGGRWDDFEGRKDWKWKKAKNRITCSSFPSL